MNAGQQIIPKITNRCIGLGYFSMAAGVVSLVLSARRRPASANLTSRKSRAEHRLAVQTLFLNLPSGAGRIPLLFAMSNSLAISANDHATQQIALYRNSRACPLGVLPRTIAAISQKPR